MTNSKFHFWQKWLTYANFMALIVGILVAFAGDSFVFTLHNDYTKQVFFDGQELSPQVVNLKAFVLVYN